MNKDQKKKTGNGKKINPQLVCIILGAAVLGVGFLSLFAGRYPLSPGTVWNVLIGGGSGLVEGKPHVPGVVRLSLERVALLVLTHPSPLSPTRWPN